MLVRLLFALICLQCSIFCCAFETSTATKVNSVTRLQDYSSSTGWDIQIPNEDEWQHFFTDDHVMQLLLHKAKHLRQDFEKSSINSRIRDSYYAAVRDVEGKIRHFLEQKLPEAATDYTIILGALQPDHPSLQWFEAMTKGRLDFLKISAQFDQAIKENRLHDPSEDSAEYYLGLMQQMNIDENRVKQAALMLETYSNSSL